MSGKPGADRVKIEQPNEVINMEVWKCQVTGKETLMWLTRDC